MGKLIDRVGEQFGHLTVLYLTEDWVQPNGTHKKQFMCACDCGRVIPIQSGYLKAGKTSCGHCNDVRIGDRVGKLIVLNKSQSHTQPAGGIVPMWNCKCDCGNYCIVNDSNLKRKHSKSCGHCKDIHVGDKFGKLEVLCKTTPYTYPTTGKILAQVICLCDCGKYWKGLENNLNQGFTTTCGCYNDDRGLARTLYQQIRDSYQYSKWRFSIMKRDNFTCQYSKLFGQGNLNVHHIKPLRQIIQENDIIAFEQTLTCKELWDINNGVTLLEEFHSQHSTKPLSFHRIYGNKKCTTDDFYIWMEKRKNA